MVNKVFGIGLSKTGTTSLAKALNLLGINTVHNPKMGGIYNGDYGVLDEWDGIVHAGTRHYSQFERFYPNSKFILTVRDRKEWLNSCKNLAEPDSLMMEFKRLDEFSMVRFDRGQYLDIYDDHITDVKGFFHTLSKSGSDEDRWMTYNICSGVGWEPLCQFLLLDMPDIPFPHENKS